MEHPVTEIVTGVDIVKEQIAEPTGVRYRQEDITPAGPLSRITAEDLFNGFVPSVDNCQLAGTHGAGRAGGERAVSRARLRPTRSDGG